MSWIKAQFNINCCRDTVGKTLKRLGLSGKKARKLLNKANSHKRAKFLETLKVLLNNALQNGQMLIYIDEAHIHLDTDEGYGWSIKGERFWVSESSPGRTKVSFYGVYIYNLGEVRIFPSQTANGLNTCYLAQSDLIEQVSAFQQRINACPNTVADRLWVTTNLKPDEEKLRVST